MDKYLRPLGYIEGISFLLLLGIAMPLKYMAGMPIAVRIAGSVHGVCFILYVVAAFMASDKRHWPPSLLGKALLAAILPFGPFVFNHKLAERQGE